MPSKLSASLPGAPTNVLSIGAGVADSSDGICAASGNAAAAAGNSKLSAFWLLLPATLLVVLALLPFGLILRGWRAGRRAERDYEAYRESANVRS